LCSTGYANNHNNDFHKDGRMIKLFSVLLNKYHASELFLFFRWVEIKYKYMIYFKFDYFFKNFHFYKTF